MGGQAGLCPYPHGASLWRRLLPWGRVTHSPPLQVSWSFDKKGVLVIDNEEGDYDEEEVMMDAMEAGADDFEADGDVFTIYTLPDDFNDVVANLSKYTFVSAQIEMVPQNYQKLESEEHIKLMEKMIEIMEDDDDVQNVWHNWEE